MRSLDIIRVFEGLAQGSSGRAKLSAESLGLRLEHRESKPPSSRRSADTARGEAIEVSSRRSKTVGCRSCFGIRVRTGAGSKKAVADVTTR